MAPEFCKWLQLLAVTGLAVHADAQPANLLANGDFEREFQGWYNWSKGGSAVTIARGAGVDGSAAAIMAAGTAAIEKIWALPEAQAAFAG